MIVKCIIVDDEPLAVSKIQTFVEKTPFLETVGTFHNGLEALDFMQNNEVDLAFLDIQMDELTGIQLVEVLKKKPLIIFTTAYEQYALKGFDLDVCDYLLKPISFNRFLQAANKAYDLLATISKKDYNQIIGSSSEISTNSVEKKDFIFLKTEYRMQKVMFDEILYIQGMKDYLLVKTPTANIMTIMTFKKLEEMLPPNEFIRIHKSYVIPVKKIESIERNMVKIGQKFFAISDTYKKEFYDFLQNSGFYTN
ncbi:MAG: LytR/AlgR family response regulator transcription factor [Deltaproteobacteria bacterium]